MKVRKVDFEKGSVAKAVLSVSCPLILAEIVNLLYNMVDRIYIGHIPGEGPLALTGLGLCFPVISLINAFSRLLGVAGGAPLCAMAMGRKDDEEAGNVVGAVFALSVIVGILLTLLVIVFMRPLLYALGASGETYGYASAYLRIYILGAVPVLLTLTMNSFINNEGFARVGMITVIIGAILNIILDPLFIFILKLGVSGAAIATLISQLVSCAFVMWFMTGKTIEVPLRRRSINLQWRRVSTIIALGFSGFVQGATNSCVQIVCNKMAFMYGGDLYVGVMTVLNSVREIFSTPVMGLAHGASPVMSYNYGAKNPERVKKASFFALYSALLVSAVVWAFVFFCPHWFAALFTQDQSLIDASVRALRIYFFGFVFMSFQSVGQQTFVALGKAKRAVFFSIFRKIIIVVPLTLLLPRFFGVDGVPMAEPISNVVGGLAAYITMYVTVFRKELSKMGR